MTQFAVYRYPGTLQQATFVVQIQSTRLERAMGRVIMPLVRLTRLSPPDHALTPHFIIRGLSVFADPFGIAAIPLSRLGDMLTVLEEPDQDRIIRAIDEMISRA